MTIPAACACGFIRDLRKYLRTSGCDHPGAGRALNRRQVPLEDKQREAGVTEPGGGRGRREAVVSQANRGHGGQKTKGVSSPGPRLPASRSVVSSELVVTCHSSPRTRIEAMRLQLLSPQGLTAATGTAGPQGSEGPRQAVPILEASGITDGRGGGRPRPRGGRGCAPPARCPRSRSWGLQGPLQPGAAQSHGRRPALRRPGVPRPARCGHSALGDALCLVGGPDRGQTPSAPRPRLGGPHLHPVSECSNLSGIPSGEV